MTKKYALIYAAAIAVLIGSTSFSLPVQAQSSADQILINGKILTVNQNFSIAEALAISGERIIAIGSTAAVKKLAGAKTKVVDLKGKTVIPGLIDNHFHLIRGVANWPNEARIDLINTHKRALDLISAKAKELGPGKWVLAIGGWSEQQFTDEQRGFSKAELDAAAPNNPVFLQRTYGAGYTNTLGLKAAGIGPDTPNPIRGKIIKDKAGNPTGVIRGFGAIVSFAKSFPKVSDANWAKSFQAMMTSLNASGLTTVHDIGGRGASLKQYALAQKLADSQNGKLSLRIFYSYRYPREKGLEAAIDSIKNVPAARANDYYQRLGIGEGIWDRLNDSLSSVSYKIKQKQLGEYKQIVATAAEGKLPIHTHAMTTTKISFLLNMFKELNGKYNIKPLRWTFAHAYGISADNLKAAKDLGMVVAFHSTPTINGESWKKVQKISGPLEMPPLRRAQESGIIWGLGTDSNVVAPYSPMNTLAMAVDGTDVAGKVLLKDQKVTRKQALIAHTRSNAFILHQENLIGSLEKGKYADLVVLDRDYMTIPTGDIRKLKSVMTMVGGRVVYQVQ